MSIAITSGSESVLLEGKTIQDSEFVRLNENNDSRGSFTEIFQKHWETAIDPVQWSMVRSNANVFRGMHFHMRHDEYFCLIKGACYLGLKDMRPESGTYMESNLYFLSEKDLCSLIFPRGVIHGWYFLKESIHIQSVSESYLDYGSEDNFGCRWDDPDLEINWPFDNPSISERASQFGGVKDLPLFD